MEQERTKEYTLLKRVEMPFSEYIQVSQKRRPKPYIKGKCRIPKKYQFTELYDWNSKGYLINKLTGEVLVSNNKVAGTPKNKKINGNEIYNGNLAPMARAHLVKLMHQRFSTYLREIDPVTDIKHFPLGLVLHFYVWDQGIHNLDNDNRWIWEKVIQDTLRELKIIPEDNPYVIWENIKRTTLISKEREQKLVVEIYGYA